MSFSKAKLIRFNEEIGCAPSPGTYNPTSDMISKVFSNNTGLKKKDSKSGETMTNSSPLKCTRTFSLPVFRTPSMKREIKLVTRSQSLVVEKDKSENIFTLTASTEDSTIRSKENLEENVSRILSSSSEEKLNIDPEEIMELFKKIAGLKYKLTICQTTEEELKKELENKNNFIQKIKRDQTSIRENINDLTDKMRIEREIKQNYTDGLLSQIEDLKIRLDNVLIEKEDLQSIIDGMKSAFIIINDRYVSLEKELKIKDEKDLKIKEINHLKLKVKNELFECTEEECISYDSTHKFEAAASNLEITANDIETYFKHIEEEFHLLKAQFNEDFETTISLIHDSVLCEMKNMEEQTLQGLYQLNKFCVATHAVIKEIFEDTDRIVEQCGTICKFLDHSEIKNVDLEVNFLTCKNLVTEIQKENIELQCNLKETKTRLKNYEISYDVLQNTTKAISKRLNESGNEIERLNKVISDNKLNVNSIETKSFKDDPTVLPDITHGVQEELKKILLELKSIEDNELNKAKVSTSKLLLRIKNLLEHYITANDKLPCVQMENNSLKLQLAHTTENLSRLETQKVERDTKLIEFATKINEQTEILEQQTHTIAKLHILLNHQHEDMMRIHLLQTDSEDKDKVISLEEKLELKNQELINLKHAYEEQLQQYDSLVKISLQQDNEQKLKCNRLLEYEEELKIHVCIVEQNLKDLENCLKIEKQRNAALESEINSLKNTLKENEYEKENLQHQNQFKKEEYDKLKENKKGISKKTRTRKHSNSNLSHLKQSPVLKDWNK